MSVDINRYKKQSNVDDDVDYTIAIMENQRMVAYSKKLYNTNPFPNHTSLFDFSNEDIKGYLKQFQNVESCLIVGGSGDQAINLIHKGTKKIDVFDKNFLVKYLIDLKLAAICSLNYEEFNRFFETFDRILFAKLKHYLPEESCYYWEQVYSKTRELNVTTDAVPNTISNFLFNYKKVPRFSRIRLNNYLENEEEYNKTKAKIFECIVSFIPSDFYDLSDNINKKYSTILLSNILEYFPNGKEDIVKEIKRYLNYVKKEFYPRLTKNGKILLTYFYQWSKESRIHFEKEYKNAKTVCQDGDMDTQYSRELMQKGLTSKHLLYYTFENMLPKKNSIILPVTHHLNDDSNGIENDEALIYTKRRKK